MITFKKQFDKLTEAYINNEVRPFDQCACFVGNLLNNRDWTNINSMDSTRDYSNFCGICTPIGFNSFDLIESVLKEECDSFYTVDNIDEMEKLFLSTYHKEGGTRFDDVNEDALFKAFEVTLDLLKQIHINKGENVEEYTFKKRELV